ncbi:MAG: histidine kinase [Flavobacteriales bacterium]|nr:histidine kinase [Flavobacteriales bacterium]
MFRFRFYATLFFFFQSAIVFSQQYNFINYSVEEGLVQSQVNTLCQDSKGYIWMGTLGGVSKFDGVDFLNYSTKNGLINNQVNSIFLDSKNNLWLGSLGGFSLKKGNEFQNYFFKTELSNYFILHITEDKDGNLWLATDGGGVVKFDGKEFTYFDISKNEVSNYVRHIFCDNQNNKWLSTRQGVFMITPKGEIKDTLPNINATQVFVEQNGDFWCSSFGDGIIHATKDTTYKLTSNDGLINNHIRAFIRKSDRSIWLVSKAGISKLDRKGIKNFTEKDGLQNSNIKTIIEDDEGNLFFGSDGGGIIKFTDENFVSYTQQEGLCSDIIMSVVQEKDSSLWFTTYGNGLCKFKNGQYKYYGEKDGLGNNTVWCNTIDNNDNLWFGTSEGFSMFDGKRFKTYDEKSGLNANKVYALSCDEDNNIWIGSKEGLSILYTEKDSIYNFDSFKFGKNIRQIHNEKQHMLWISCSDGLIRYNSQEKTIKKYTVNDGLPDNSVMAVVNDNDNRMWIGTKNGLAFMQNGKIQAVTISENSSSNNINFLNIDSYQNLWIGTNNGLYQFDLKTKGEISQASFIRYSNLDGLKSLECNQNASFIDFENNLWFGTSLGLMKHPLYKKDNSIYLPKIILKDVRLFFESKNWKKIFKGNVDDNNLPVGLVLTYNKNHLTFDFDGIYHKSPDKIKYRFKLNGFDESWQPETKANFVTYSNIPPGDYEFNISASVDSVNWTTPIAFSFSIKPPFWFTWWFYLLMFLFLVGITWLIINRRVKVIEQKRATERLENQAKMLALEQQALNASLNRHFIFNALNSIQYYINREDKISANKYLSSFAKLVRKNLDSSMENETDLDEELERIDLYLKLEQMRFQNKFDYQIKCEAEALGQSIKIPSMLLQPFIENSIWHGILPAQKHGEIFLSVKKKEETIVINVKDNGIGIENSLAQKENKKQLHVSKGMALTKGRINLLSKITNKKCFVQGPFQIYHQDGSVAGTEVSIIINLQKDFNE